MTTNIVPQHDEETQAKQQQLRISCNRLVDLAVRTAEPFAPGLLANTEVLVPLAIAMYEAALDAFRRLS